MVDSSIAAALCVGRVGPLGELVAAIRFLSRFPVPGHGTSAASTGAAAFGVVGALIGGAASIAIVAFGSAHPLLAAVASVGVVGVLSGALHLDGLGDTVDALAAGPGRAEEARMDPRVGAAGVAAIVLALFVEVAALADLAAGGSSTAAVAIIAATAVSRASAPVWAVLVGRRVGSAVRAATGLGTWFVAGTSPVAAALAAISAIVVAALAAIVGGLSMLVGAAAGLAIATLVGAVVIRARGQLDGDGYGFAIEATFAAILVATALAA